MRIGIDGLPLTEPLAGVGHYTLELARHLAGNSHDDLVEVISPRSFLPSLEVTAEVDSHLRFTKRAVNLLSRRWWSIGLPRYLQQGGVDIFHGTNFEVPLPRVCPSVVTVHDLSLLLYPETHERRRVWRARRRLPLMARRATLIITPSRAVRDEVHRHLHIPLERIMAVPSAARECFRRMEATKAEHIRKRLGVESQFVLYAGTVEPRKNLSRLVQAFSRVPEGLRRSLRLVIAGKKGWLVDDLFQTLRESGTGENVVFTGYLNDEELRALYSTCRLFVYPSIYEGFGLPPLEAMACGAPVIASRIPSIEEVAGPAAHLVSPDSVEDLAMAMKDVLENDDLRRKLITAGERRAREFSWTLTADRTRDVYVSAIKRFHERTPEIRKWEE